MSPVLGPTQALPTVVPGLKNVVSAGLFLLILGLSFSDYLYSCQESTIITRAHDNTLDRRCWIQANALSFASRETPSVCLSAEQSNKTEDIF